jgi:cytoskeletal protein RodZ
VFEIGTSLREARLRQGIELPRVEADTKIRAKYLRALEEERFEVLPAETYVKGFLRTYAEYLGLDGQLYVDEFNSRFARSEDPLVAPSSTPQRARSRPAESNFVVVALAGIVAVTILVVVAWRVGSGDTTNPRSFIGTQPIGQAPATTAETTPPPTPPPAPGAAEARLAKLVLTAARGDCWVQVRAGSANGRLIYEGTVQQGQAQRFARWSRLWLELGAPSNLNAQLNGRRLKNFPQQPSIVIVTAKGVRTVSTV